MHVELETPPWRSNELQCHARCSLLAARCSLHAARCTVHSRAGHKTRKKPMSGEQQGQGGGGRTRGEAIEPGKKRATPLRTRICSKHGHRYYKYTMRTHCQNGQRTAHREGEETDFRTSARRKREREREETENG